MLMPEQFLQHLKTKIKPEWKTAFFSAFLIGFLTYLWHLSSFLVNGDSILNFHTDQNTIHLGRCFLTYACGISSFYDLPTVNGLLGILYVALCSVVIVELFHLRKKLSIVLVSGLLITFPSVASTFAYNFTADGYLLAMLFSALAVLLTCRYRFGLFAGALLLCLSYGSYQAYIAFAMMMIIVWIIWQILFMDNTVKHMFRTIGRLLAMGILGSLAYVASLNLLLLAQGKKLSSYQGISGFTQFSLAKIKTAVISCLRYFKHFFLGDLTPSLYTALNLLLVLLIAYVICRLAWKKRIFCRIPECIVLLLCLIAIPFVTAIVYFISPDVAYHTLMCAGFSMIYLLPVLYLEQTKSTVKADVVFSWTAFGVLTLTIYNFILAANINFLYMNRSYEITYALALRITDRIEQLETETPITQIGIIGEIKTEESGYNLNLPPEMTGAMFPYIVSEQFGMTAFLNDYFGMKLRSAPDDVVIPFVHTEKYQTMNIWPGENSVMVDGDTVYIKFEEVAW